MAVSKGRLAYAAATDAVSFWKPENGKRACSCAGRITPIIGAPVSRRSGTGHLMREPTPEKPEPVPCRRSSGCEASHAQATAELALPGRWWRPSQGDSAQALQGVIIRLLAEHQFAATPAVLLGPCAYHRAFRGPHLNPICPSLAGIHRSGQAPSAL